MIRGFQEAWKEGRDFAWDNVLAYVWDVIVSEALWAEQYEDKHSNPRTQLMCQAAALVQEGTRSDAHAFSEDLLPLAEEIISFLLQKAEPEALRFEDVVTAVLNSQQGHVFNAAMSLCLRHARLSEKKGNKEWLSSIRTDFTERLTGSKRTTEFSVTLGKYLPHLNYLDAEWVRQNISDVYPQDREAEWKPTMEAYLFHTTKVYEGVYALLRETGNYDKALGTDFGREIPNNRVAQHIAVAYSHGQEDLNDADSLIRQIIESENARLIIALVRWVGVQGREVFLGKLRELRTLWQTLYGKLQDVADRQQFREAITSIASWAKHLDRIDAEAEEWLTFSAQHLGRHLDGYELAQELVRLAQASPAEAAQVCLAAIKRDPGVFPIIDEVRRLVAILYENGKKEAADEICSRYGESGAYQLRGLYEQYNPPPP